MEKQLKEKIRSVVRKEFVSELSKNDVHVKEIMKFYDKGTYSTKKAVSIFVSGKTNATRNQILDDLGDMGYNDAWEVMDHFKLKIESANEAAVPTGERIQNLNNRIKALRDKLSATKSTEQKKLFQDRLKNALQTLSNIKKDYSIKKESVNEKNDDDFTDYLSSRKSYSRPTNWKVIQKDGKYSFESDGFSRVRLMYNGKQIASGANDWSTGGYEIEHSSWNNKEKPFQFAKDVIKYFKSKKLTTESVNETTLNEGFGDSIKKIRNLAIKMASTKYDRAKSHLNLDKIASADDFDGKDTMNKATAALLQQNDLDEDLKSAINKIAVKLGTGSTMLGIITALVSMSGWIQYLNSSFTKWYYTEIQKLAEPEVMKVMQDLGSAGQAEGSIYGKLGMYAFFIFFTIAVISLVAARMTKGTKKEYVDKKGVEHVAAALPQTEEEPIKECKTCNSK
jgi:hypothetical protein